ncbi:MAG TPA: acyl dehydratase [Rhodospirillaceae bacterium]|nr:acyl dehydratase [Alphaproteobacteria bacterium]OUT39614.1 MAG: acyl dehydratase [Micavibrio sp. TMED2]HCI46399.1 acyl dehydratase [Rhodospirillaceae bacterium]MAS49007.1 acyl dehydratase [Alphaproteobacteria bacterium]MAX97391.1 acyl dehydratase [Alphaproteobacteria bacterium]|tara:strand:+ start:3404 stop:3871 length:468 start_codon:yes stop_codon:yes gene_type:complete
MATGRYFEDFQVGDVIETAGMTITESQILDFASTYDPQPFHVDAVAAAASPFGGIIASGFQTLSLSFRLVCDTGMLNGTGLGSGGGENLRWMQPVRPGDTLYVRLEVLETRASKSSSDRGNVRIRYVTSNQKGTPVMEITFHHLVKRRSPETVAV